MNGEKIQAAVDFLRQESTRLSFGEVTVKVIIHNGDVKRIERTICEKEQY